METYYLIRKEDKTGLSGTGIVADIIEFSDGQVVLKWRGETSTIVIHKNMESVRKISGSRLCVREDSHEV
jgi:hypothetical protein